MERRKRKYSGLNDEFIITDDYMWSSTGYEVKIDGEWMAEYEDTEGNVHYKKIGGKVMMFTVDSFGSNCPNNWEEIAEYLNGKIEDGLDNDDLEEIWETYCNGGYPDAPEAEFEELKMMYTADRETGTFIDPVETVEEGLALIDKYEAADKADGTYEPDFYDIVDKDHCSVI